MKIAIIASLAACAMVLSACSSVESFLGSPTGAVVITAAVDVAVGTAESKGVSATEINKIATAALAADSGVNATVATVSAAIDAAIVKAKLPAGDQAAADILSVALSAAISAKIGSNPSVAAAQAAVADVLHAVIAAT
jgi:hypothetical protein